MAVIVIPRLYGIRPGAAIRFRDDPEVDSFETLLSLFAKSAALFVLSCKRLNDGQPAQIFVNDRRDRAFLLSFPTRRRADLPSKSPTGEPYNGNDGQTQ